MSEKISIRQLSCINIYPVVTTCCVVCFRFLVDQGCIPPLCDLLTVMDGKIVQVALNGLENILRLGEQDAKLHSGTNPYAVMIEECYGECSALRRVSARIFKMPVQNIHSKISARPELATDVFQILISTTF